MVAGYGPRVPVDYPTLLLKTEKEIFFVLLYPSPSSLLPVLCKTMRHANKERVPYQPEVCPLVCMNYIWGFHYVITQQWEKWQCPLTNDREGGGHDSCFPVRAQSVLSDVLLGRVMAGFSTRARFLCLNHFTSGLNVPLLLEKEEFYNAEDGFLHAYVSVLWDRETISWERGDTVRARGDQLEWESTVAAVTARVKYILLFRNRSQEDNEGRNSTQVGDLVGVSVCVCVGSLSSFPVLSWVGGRVI